MELRERIARAIIPHLYYEYEGWDATELTALATTPEALNHITRQLHVMAERSRQ